MESPKAAAQHHMACGQRQWLRHLKMGVLKQCHQMGIRSLASSCQVCKAMVQLPYHETPILGSWAAGTANQPGSLPLAGEVDRAEKDTTKQLCLMAPEVLLGHSLALKALKGGGWRTALSG